MVFDLKKVLTSSLLALAFGDSHVSQADIVIHGGTPAQQRLLASVYDSEIPSALHSGKTVVVNILNDRDMYNFIHDGTDPNAANSETDNLIDGVYEDHPPTITLRGSIGPNDIPYTFAHEYGHFVWQNEMTRSDRSRYGDLYDHAKKSGRLVTEYAASELDEGFAEAVSYFVMDRATLDHRDSLSCRFLDDLTNRTMTASRNAQ